MKTILALFLILLTARSAPAVEVTGAEIVEFGTFRKLAVSENSRAPKSLTGEIHAVREAVLDESGTDIHASLGTSFGVRVKINGKPADAPVTCTFRWAHPKMTDPGTGKVSETDEWEATATIGLAQYTGFTFDADWELVPGKWTLQLIYDGKVLAEKTFDLTIQKMTRAKRLKMRESSLLPVILSGA